MSLVYFTVYKLHRYTESYIEWDIDMHSLFHVCIISFNLPYIFLLYTSLCGALKRLFLTSYPDYCAFMIQFSLHTVFNKLVQPQIFLCLCSEITISTSWSLVECQALSSMNVECGSIAKLLSHKEPRAARHKGWRNVDEQWRDVFYNEKERS